MTMQLRTETLPANGVLVLDAANTIYLVSASATVNLTLQQHGANESFPGIPAGTIIKRVRNWTANSQITGAQGTQVIFFYGIESHRDDSTEFNIATVTGSIPTSYPSASINQPTDHADVAVAGGATDSTITSNANRKYVLIGSLSTNNPATTNLRVRGHGNAIGGIELQPGTFISIPTDGALDVFNGDANAQTYWWQEQT